MQIYIHRNNQQLGPFTEAEIRAQLASGAISLQDHVWWQGQTSWVPLGQSSLVTSGVATNPTAQGIPTAQAPVIQVTSPLAIWSLVCGCLTLICGLLASIPAIVLGHLALGQIKKTPGLKGRGLAITGLVIGYLMTLFGLAVLTAYLMFLPQIMKMAKEGQFSTTFPQFTNSDETPSSPDATTNSTPAAPIPDQTTNAPDQATNAAPAPMTNTAPASTNAPDQSTNSVPAPVNLPDASTNTSPSNTNSPMPVTTPPPSSTNAPAATNTAPLSQ